MSTKVQAVGLAARLQRYPEFRVVRRPDVSQPVKALAGPTVRRDLVVFGGIVHRVADELE